MKRIFFVLLLIMAPVAGAYAVPASPVPIKVTQPDGTVLTIRMHGDEFLNWATCGSSLVTQDSCGYWCYARFNSDGTSIATPSRVLSTGAGDGSGIVPPASALAGASAARCSSSPSLASSSFEGWALGERHIPVLLVEFPDRKFTYTKADFEKMLNQEGYSYDGASGSVSQYFSDVSYGKFKPIFDVYGPVQVPYNAAYYSKYQANAKTMAISACRIAQDTLHLLDFNDYKFGSAGVKGLSCIYAGCNRAESASSNSIYPHAVTSDLCTIDGVKICGVSFSSEFSGAGATMARIGVFTHEFCHNLGLPDFYDTNGSSDGLAPGLYSLSIMAYGCYNNGNHTPPYMNYEERHIAGWDDGLTLLTEGIDTLYGIAENKSYYLPTQTDGEYYIFESRPRKGWDSSTGMYGLAIFHVDKSSNKVLYSGYTAKQCWKYQRLINAYLRHQCMDLVESHYPESEVTRGAQTVFPGEDNVTAFTTSSLPAALDWDGRTLWYELRNIVFDSVDGMVTVDVSDVATISGIIKNTSGAPVGNVDVAVKRISASDDAGTGSDSTYFRMTTGADGRYDTGYLPAGTYRVTASRVGYSTVSSTVCARGVTEADVTILSVREQAGVTLRKYKGGDAEVTEFGCADGAGASIEADLKFTPTELEPYVGEDISYISFYIENYDNGDAVKVGVRVYFDDVMQCDIPVDEQVYGSICIVDISGAGLKIPADTYVDFAYYVINPSYDSPCSVEVTQTKCGDYYYPLDSDGMRIYGEFNKMGTYTHRISAQLVSSGRVLSASGINVIQKNPTYKAGDVFELKLQESSLNPPSGVTWTVDGQPAQESVVLTSGVHTVRAQLTYSSGRTEVLKTTVSATE